MAEPFLTLKQVSKHYVGVTALDHVDFQINKGEIHCLAGENGSGKSTMIKIISGTVEADPGSQLEFEGVVETIRGKGVFVASGANPFAENKQNEILEGLIDPVIIQAFHFNINKDELLKMIDEKYNEFENKRQE